MRRWIIIVSLGALLLLAALSAAVCYFGLGWWHPSHEVASVKSGGYDSQSEAATLEEALANAREALAEVQRKASDYLGVIIKRERVGTKLVETMMFAKIRQTPFSVYLRFLDRSDNKNSTGREVIYVQGRNDDKLIVHTPGFQDMTVGTLRLDPKGWPAMQGERYPITEIGLANLCRQLIKRGEAAGDPKQVEVKRYHHAPIKDRMCSLLEITYPVKEPKVRGYLARVFVDDNLHFPIRVEVYELPLDLSQGPQLVEEYTYLDLKFNNGYTDADFDPKNRQYKFP